MRWRDLGCGELRAEHVGRDVTVAGGVNTRRDHGGLVFVDLRDQTGLCQLVVNPETAAEAHAAARDVRNEFVLHAEGQVVARSVNRLGEGKVGGYRVLEAQPQPSADRIAIEHWRAVPADRPECAAVHR